MTKKLVIFFFLINLLGGCSNSSKADFSIPGFAESIKEIDIYNKTGRSFNLNKLEIKDKDRIRKICTEIKKMEEVNSISTKAHFGYYSVELLTEKNNTYSLDVFYTIYNGVVIHMNNKTYKNDALETLILYYFE